MPRTKNDASKVGADDLVALGATAADVNGLPREELPPLQHTGRPARPLTDLGNAERFVRQHGENVRFVHDWKCWFIWDGRRWGRDPGDTVARLMEQTVKALWTEATSASSADERELLLKHARRSESEAGIRHALELAKSYLPVWPEELDANPWLLNCLNGTLELRTLTLRQPRREDYLTKLTAAPYVPDEWNVMWEMFIESAIPDAGARAYAQRFAGYCLTGLTSEEVFVFCRGPAGAGKSTYIEALRRTWGAYGTTADFSTFVATKKAGGGPQEEIARLAGARLVTSVETRDGQRFAEGLVKLLTGGDTVAARRMYERTFEFIPQFKLLFGSNYRLQADASDDGLWRRLRELPFPTARPRREDRDGTLKAVLTDPSQAGAAILAWAARGLADYLANALGEPATVMQATAAYRREQEPLARFVADCCVLSPTASVPAQRLRDEYDNWCRSQGIKHPLAGKAWGEALKALGCVQRRTRDARFWDGIDLNLFDSTPLGREPGDDDPALIGDRR
jgi:putative DNA primase/helicase